VAPAPLTKLEDAEREHILRALPECRWLVGANRRRSQAGAEADDSAVAEWRV